MVLGFLIWCIMSLVASVSKENIVSIMEAPSNYQNKLRKFIYLFIYMYLR